MPNDTLITVTCPRCKHTWQEDLAQLEQMSQPLFKVFRATPAPAKTTYRVRCPNDGTYIVIEVEEVRDG